jgi:NADPH-dependent 2,4-dienoyl-CoA reductase/sulfur reductase-like enzyme
MRLVVIGGVAAGTKAASRARRVDPDIEITIYQEEPEISISECGLPYLISGVVEDRDNLIARTPEDFAEKDVEVFAHHRVEKIDPDGKTLVVKNLATDEEFEDSYDRLIIATGGKAIIPPIDGVDSDGVFVLRFLSDTDKIMDFVQRWSPKKAVVIGGGYIGLEVSENLIALGMEVTIVEARERIGGAAYGDEVAGKIRQHIEEKGVRVCVGEEVETLLRDEEGRVRAACFGEEEIEAQIVIVATGARPEAKLAEEAGQRSGASVRSGWTSTRRRASPRCGPPGTAPHPRT